MGRKRPSNGNTKLNGTTEGSKAYPRKSIYATAPPVQQSAVARVLGDEMLSEIRQTHRGRGVNVELLLRGAEKLCEAYAVAGATDKVTSIRKRHQQVATSLEEYEEKVLQQQSSLNRFHSGSGYGVEDEAMTAPKMIQPRSTGFSQQDVDAEDAEIRELEARKKALEERVAAMEKDLGGLLR